MTIEHWEPRTHAHALVVANDLRPARPSRWTRLVRRLRRAWGQVRGGSL